MLRPGTVRWPGIALAAFWAASRAVKSGLAPCWPASFCAAAGKENAMRTASGMRVEDRVIFIIPSSLETKIAARLLISGSEPGGLLDVEASRLGPECDAF
jgi:hypothetical protein